MPGGLHRVCCCGDDEPIAVCEACPMSGYPAHTTTPRVVRVVFSGNTLDPVCPGGHQHSIVHTIPECDGQMLFRHPIWPAQAGTLLTDSELWQLFGSTDEWGNPYAWRAYNQEVAGVTYGVTVGSLVQGRGFVHIRANEYISTYSRYQLTWTDVVHGPSIAYLSLATDYSYVAEYVSSAHVCRVACGRNYFNGPSLWSNVVPDSVRMIGGCLWTSDVLTVYITTCSNGVTKTGPMHLVVERRTEGNPPQPITAIAPRPPIDGTTYAAMSGANVGRMFHGKTGNLTTASPCVGSPIDDLHDGDLGPAGGVATLEAIP